MVDYFRAGGFTMWFILFSAIATVVMTAVRGKDERARILFLGAFACLAFAVLGMSLGMVAVAKYVGRYPDRVAATAEGLGELSSNGSFGSLWALAFALGGVVTTPRKQLA